MRTSLTPALILLGVGLLALFLALGPLRGAANTGSWLLQGRSVGDGDGGGTVDPPTDPQLVARYESARAFEHTLFWQGVAGLVFAILLFTAGGYVLGARFGMPAFPAGNGGREPPGSARER